jgi:two-component system, sensor histidine kinase and response regulator
LFTNKEDKAAMQLAPPSRGDVLIVDDALPNLRLLSRMLTSHGYQVRGVSNSNMVMTVVQAEAPDLILLDINMPGQNGYEVCAALKSEATTADIPVIFMSALDDVPDKVRAFAVGGVDYIPKPFQVEEVLARVETHLTLQSLQKQLRQQVQTLQSLTNDLVLANSQLQASNNELNAFAHTVAHDLKNPLATIMLTADITERYLKQGNVEKSCHTLSALRNGVHKLDNIIDELLLLSSVRKETVVKSPLIMDRIVAQALLRLQRMNEQFAVTVDAPASWPRALGYAPWVEEVWVNYLSNGIKYGGAPPALVLGADNLPNGRVCFWVQDNGPGIEAAKLDNLFVEFTRLEQTRAQGHGLGLSIVKRIVEKLDGEVGVASTPGEGSRFYFVLPGA